MDEITLINLLNKICEKNRALTWKLNCKYHNGLDTSIMQVYLYQAATNQQKGNITFMMETGRVIGGQHRGLVAFQKATHLVDALLEILHYEGAKMNTSLN